MKIHYFSCLGQCWLMLYPNKGGFRRPMIARTQSCSCSSLLPAMLLSGFRAGKFLRSLMSALYTLEYCRTIVVAVVKKKTYSRCQVHTLQRSEEKTPNLIKISANWPRLSCGSTTCCHDEYSQILNRFFFKSPKILNVS